MREIFGIGNGILYVSGVEERQNGRIGEGKREWDECRESAMEGVRRGKGVIWVCFWSSVVGEGIAVSVGYEWISGNGCNEVEETTWENWNEVGDVGKR